MIQKISSSKTVPGENAFFDAWNRLWDSSADTMPLARGECLERFANGFHSGTFETVSARDADQLVAAMALIEGRKWRIFRSFESPNNPWLQAGGLLTDKGQVNTGSFRQIANQIKSLPCSFIKLDWMDETIEVQRLINELQLCGCRVYREHQLETGIINISGDWTGYLASRSKSFRKKIRSSLRKLESIGDVRFERYVEFENHQHLESLIDAALDIEERSWKGQQGSSVNSDPQIRETFIAVLFEIALAGMLEIQFLTVGDRRIAFEIGYQTHQTYFSHKVSYDPAFARFGPGQLLMYYQMRHWFADGEVKRVDTVGEINEASAKWCNEIRTRYRYIVATRFASSHMLRGLEWLKPQLKRFLRR